MKKFLVLASSCVFSSLLYGKVFTPADPSEAPAGIVYDTTQPEVLQPNRLRGKRVAILASHGVQESELVFPYEYLQRRGATVDIVAPSWTQGKIIAVKYLLPTLWIEASESFESAKANDYDLIVLTGGAWNSNVVRSDPIAIDFIKNHAKKGGIIAAICAGSQILINADLAEGRSLTGTMAIKLDLENAGAKYFDEPVVVDGKLITSRGPKDVLQFSKALALSLAD